MPAPKKPSPSSVVSAISEALWEFHREHPDLSPWKMNSTPSSSELVATVDGLTKLALRQRDQISENLAVMNEAELAKREFLANMSHEIRTPMNGILGMVELILQTEPDSELADQLMTIRSSMELLLNILNDVLLFSKLGERNVSLVKRDFAPARLIEGVLQTFESIAAEKQIHFSAEIDGDVPSFLIADDLRIQQVLYTLVKNGLKFTPANGHVKVRLDVSRPYPEQVILRFDVEDTGIGIEKEQLNSLFKPFTQVDSSFTRKYGGTGLGLAIARNLVDLMQGEISVSSKVGKGSCFSFEVAALRTKVRSSDAIQLPTIERKDSVRSSWRNSSQNIEKPLQVLLVEDNPVNQQVASMSLKRLGCDVELANNGQEAVDKASRGTVYDLICMDLQMPVMDGLEAIRQIRAENGANTETFTLALTGLAFDEDRERCRIAGMNDFLTKPIDLSALAELVDCIQERKEPDLVLAN